MGQKIEHGFNKTQDVGTPTSSLNILASSIIIPAHPKKRVESEDAVGEPLSGVSEQTENCFAAKHQVNSDLTNDVGGPTSSTCSAAKQQAGTPTSSSGNQRMSAGSPTGNAESVVGEPELSSCFAAEHQFNSDLTNDVGEPTSSNRSAAKHQADSISTSSTISGAAPVSCGSPTSFRGTSASSRGSSTLSRGTVQSESSAEQSYSGTPTSSYGNPMESRGTRTAFGGATTSFGGSPSSSAESEASLAGSEASAQVSDVITADDVDSPVSDSSVLKRKRGRVKGSVSSNKSSSASKKIGKYVYSKDEADDEKNSVYVDTENYFDAGRLDDNQPMKQDRKLYNEPIDIPDCSEERWKSVWNVSDEYKLYISNHGRVRIIPEIKTNKHGRRFLNIHGVMYPIDVLVASLFTTNPTKSELVIHTDSSVGNDRADNLCWVPNKTVDYPVITMCNMTTNTYQHKLYPRQTVALMKDMMHRMILDKILVPLMPGLARCQRQVIYDGISEEMNDEVLEYIREKYPYMMPDDIEWLGDKPDRFRRKWNHVVKGNNEYLLSDEEYARAKENKVQQVKDRVTAWNEYQIMSNLYDGGIDGVKLGVDVGPSGVYMDDKHAREYVDDLRKNGESRLSSLQYTDFNRRMREHNGAQPAKRWNNTDYDKDCYGESVNRSAAEHQAGSSHKTDDSGSVSGQKSSDSGQKQMTAGDWFGSAYGAGGMSGAVETVVKKKVSGVPDVDENNTDLTNDSYGVSQANRSAAKQLADYYYEDDDDEDDEEDDDSSEDSPVNIHINREDNEDDSLAGLYRGGNTKKVIKMKEDAVKRQQQREQENVNYKRSSGRVMFDEFKEYLGGKPMTMEEYKKKLEEYEEFREQGFMYANFDESVFEGGVTMLDHEPLLTPNQRHVRWMRENGKSIDGTVVKRDDTGIRYFLDENGKWRVIMEIPAPELLTIRGKWNFGGGRRSPVLCTFPNGKEMVFWSIICAAKYLNLDIANIVNCCLGKSSMTGGMKFRYVDVKDETRVNDFYEARLEEDIRASEDDDTDDEDCIYVLKPKIDENGNTVDRKKGRPKKSEYRKLYKPKQTAGGVLNVIDKALGDVFSGGKKKKIKLDDYTPTEQQIQDMLDSSLG